MKTHYELDYVYSELREMTTAEEKFMFIRYVMKEHCVKVNNLPENPVMTKKMQKACEFLSRGNMFFRSKMYELSVLEYSLSVINSVPGTERHTLALANRSAAFFKIRQFDDCLKDIRRALESNYPVAMVYKLYLRAGHADRSLGHGESAKNNFALCLKHLDQSVVSEEDKNIIRIEATRAIENCDNLVEMRYFEDKTVECLVGGKNENIPALSKFVELKSSTTMGRGVYATRDINPGKYVIGGLLYLILFKYS